eukprot:4472432-Prymnesium_polylepis.3
MSSSILASASARKPSSYSSSSHCGIGHGGGRGALRMNAGRLKMFEPCRYGSERIEPGTGRAASA